MGAQHAIVAFFTVPVLVGFGALQTSFLVEALHKQVGFEFSGLIEVRHPNEAALREDVFTLALAKGKTVFTQVALFVLCPHLVSVLAVLALNTRVLVCVTFSLATVTGNEYDVLRQVKEFCILSVVSHCLVSAKVAKCDLHQRHLAWLHDDVERSKFVHS